MEKTRTRAAAHPKPRRRRLWRRGLPRKLKFTREGRFLLLFVMGVGFAAVNTGNNLLYLVLGLLLSLIIVSGMLSEMTLRSLRVTLTPPREAHAGEPAVFGVHVSNTKRRAASFSLEVELHGDDPRQVQTPARILYVPSDGEGEGRLAVTFERRGRYRFDGVRLATRFPFGFFRKWRVHPFEGELVVYPALIDVEAPTLPAASAGHAARRPRAGRGDEYYALRDLRPGDDLRDVCWKVSARVGDLVVRENEEPVRRAVTLYLPNATPNEDRETLERVERAISAAATLALTLTGRDVEVGLTTLDAQLPPGGSARHITRLLRTLALLDVYVPRAGEPLVLDCRGHRGDPLLVRHTVQRALPLGCPGAAILEVGEDDGAGFGPLAELDVAP